MTAGDASGREAATGEDGGRRVDAADATGAGGTEDDMIPVRLTMPDRWLEHVERLPLSTTVEEAKAIGLRRLLLRDTDHPEDFYTEYAEREVRDESVTLEALGVSPNEVLSIRAYDLGHYPRFRG